MSERYPTKPHEIFRYFLRHELIHDSNDVGTLWVRLRDWYDASVRRRMHPELQLRLPEYRIVYFIQAPMSRWIKVGHGYNPPSRAGHVQGSGTDVPYHFLRVIPEIPGRTERDFHAMFADALVPTRGVKKNSEWFYPTGEILNWVTPYYGPGYMTVEQMREMVGETPDGVIRW